MNTAFYDSAAGGDPVLFQHLFFAFIKNTTKSITDISSTRDYSVAPSNTAGSKNNKKNSPFNFEAFYAEFEILFPDKIDLRKIFLNGLSDSLRVTAADP